MTRAKKLTVAQRNALAVAWFLPWVIYGVVSLDLLPLAWRYESWPEGLRSFCLVLFAVYIILELVHAMWYLFQLFNRNSSAK
jgi:hypothetical protein